MVITTNNNLLKIKDLDISFIQARGTAHALRGIDLTISSGEILALVGESGSGKTVTSMSIMGLVPTPPARINAGSLLFKGDELIGRPHAEMRKIRGNEIAMVFQEPAKYLNPSLKIGEQITEMLILHLAMSKKQAVEKALEYLDVVGLGKSRRVLNAYPARTFRRYETAGHDRHGHLLQPFSFNSRRTNHRAGCHPAVADPETDPQP
jgi:ABC-type dipeptide/oligopeptide/nickel transport system ATPase component